MFKMAKLNEKLFVDWLIVGFMMFVCAINEIFPAIPNLREINFNDVRIQYKYNEFDHIPNELCLILAIVMPFIAIFALSLRKNDFNQLQINLLAFCYAVGITGIVTGVLKTLFGSPRPDFISRCLPDYTLLGVNGMGGVEVCKQKNLNFLYEGLRSTPSGHSSLSFNGLNFLMLWIWGQYGLFNDGVEMWKLIIGLCPDLLATYIAISRYQDNKHSLFDITFGSTIGILISTLVYYKFFKGQKRSSYLEESVYSSV